MNILNWGELTREQFLAEYWQKKPLLIRNAFPDFEPILDAEDLAGLACEENVETRLITEDPDTGKWELSHGPLAEDAFEHLPESHWTMLVQAVDHWVPEAAELLQQFNFIPSWRRDDLMISYAADGGGVGPHYDNYDVFLIQAAGQRCWEVGGIFDENSPIKPDTPVRIVTEWAPEDKWVLEPGDMLYLPPQVGHNGYAVGDGCMTYSVGFRAPSHGEILREFTDYIGEQLKSEIRYQDADLTLPVHAAEIGPDALKRVRSIFERYLNDDALLSNWFGQYMTDPKYPDLDPAPEENITEQELLDALTEGYALQLNEGSRLAWHKNSDNSLTLFADGQSYALKACQLGFVENLTASPALIPSQPEADQLTLLTALVNRGCFYIA